MQTATRVSTLAEATIPRGGLLRDALLIVGGSLLTALCAQIVIPLTPVPITGQTFAVLLTGAALGALRGTAAIGLYVVEGLVGLPVFAGGGAGLARLQGPTGGYLLGFIAAAYLTGTLAERGWDRRVRFAAVAMAAGNVVIYLFGVPWLALYLGWADAVTKGLLPFILGDFLKLAAAALALPGAWVLVRRGDVR
ncbi:MAG TPA: biotin transporter BioY [Candidatus Methylomirabilis sp.]|jgi:biotin transport system substrate-specific component|nr:biotin transporter BioY [Candidatus Methylomirabilis sp.]